MIDAAAYGKALFDLALEEGRDEAVSAQLETVCTAVTSDYETLLDSPALQVAERLSLLKDAFGDVQPILLNFLCILCEKRSFFQLSACKKTFDACYDGAHNILRATAITAIAMKDSQLVALREKLGKLTGKEVVLENQVDEKLLGGITLRYAGVQLDESLKSRLDTLRRSLAEAIV